MSEILTNGCCSRCGCYVGEMYGHVCFVQNEATKAPPRLTVTYGCTECTALRADLDRAKAALREIAVLSKDCGDDVCSGSKIKRIARAALESEMPESRS